MASISRKNNSFLQSALNRYLLAAGLCILLHLPFLLFKKPSASIVPKDMKSVFPPIVCMRSPHDSSLAAWEKEYYEWADIVNPTQLIKPNSQNGFTAFGFPQTERSDEPFQPAHFSPCLLPYPQLVNVLLTYPPFDLSDAIYGNWNNVTLIKPAARRILPVADGVTWRFISGAAVKNAPVITAQALALCRRSAGLSTAFNAITHLEIIQDGTIAIPRVIVRKSCGLASLDRLALNAVRKIMLSPSPEIQLNGTQPNTPLNGDCTMMAIWHLHPLEEK